MEGSAMSIFPRTDLVVDVARAADPQKRDIAVRRLSEPSQAIMANGASFDGHIQSANAQSSKPPGLTRAASGVQTAKFDFAPMAIRSETAPRAEPSASDAVRSFEAFFLQSFIELMLPKEGDAAYGHGTGGGIWRSMMAEHLGTRIGRAGGFGLHKIFDRQFGLSAGAAASARPTTSHMS
jgi:hypothetical protein